MSIKRNDNIVDELFNFKVVHGRAGLYYLFTKNYNEVPFVSKDIKIVMISNFKYPNYLNEIYLNTPNKLNIEFIHLDKPVFQCGIDLIEPLYNYVKNIDEKYILYLDTIDTAILSDITDPQEILDKYNCKILFNAEDGYSFPDHGCVDKTYINKFNSFHASENVSYYAKLNDAKEINLKNLWSKIKCEPYRKSLNSGLFLADRAYLVEVLQEMLYYMYEDPTKGYPYGEIENQKLWQFIQSTRTNNEIEIDYLNLYFLWIHDRKFTFPIDSWEHYDFFYRNFKNI